MDNNFDKNGFRSLIEVLRNNFLCFVIECYPCETKNEKNNVSKKTI